MIIEAGADHTAVLINTDKVLTVTEDGPRRSWLVFTDGSREIFPVLMARFEDVPGFRPLLQATRDGTSSEIVVNLAHLRSARATDRADEILVTLDQPAAHSDEHPKIRLRLSLPEFADLLRRDEAPGPSM